MVYVLCNSYDTESISSSVYYVLQCNRCYERATSHVPYSHKSLQYSYNNCIRLQSCFIKSLDSSLQSHWTITSKSRNNVNFFINYVKNLYNFSLLMLYSNVPYNKESYCKVSNLKNNLNY